MAPRSKKRIRNPDGTWSNTPVKPQTLKRKHIEDADGWTHVVGSQLNKVRESIDTNVVYIDRNLEEMSAQHEKTLKRWQENDVRKTLIAAIEAFEKTSSIKIKKVVCLGLGTLSNGNMTQQNNRHAQLAALMDVVESLGGPEKLKLVAQDPLFGPCDKSFLNSLGFQVVESPGAFEAIDTDTLVHAIHCQEEIYEEIAKTNRPSIMIGNDFEQWLSVLPNAPVWLESLAGDYHVTSAETAMFKGKARQDSFDQIFYFAFYATRLHIRKSSTNSEAKDGSSTQARGVLVTLESHDVEEPDTPENSSEMASREESPCDEDTIVAEHETFDIFDDLKNLALQADPPVQETPPTDIARGDPVEDKENLPPEQSEMPLETPVTENVENRMDLEMADETDPVNK